MGFESKFVQIQLFGKYKNADKTFYRFCDLEIG